MAAIIIIFALAIATLLINLVVDHFVFPTFYTLSHHSIPESADGLTFIVISDLHDTVFWGGGIERIISEVAKTVPNTSKIAVVFSGDMVIYPHSSVKNTLEIAKKATNLGIKMFGAIGNHEGKHPDCGGIIQSLEAGGVRMLCNNAVDFHGINVIGVNDPQKYVGQPRNNPKDIETVKETISGLLKNDKFNVVFFHRVNFFPHLSALGAELIVSGHLHGGVVRLPFIGGLVGESFKLFPKYCAGLYEKDRCTLIASRGCDRKFIRTRIFNPPEVVVITLKSKKHEQ